MRKGSSNGCLWLLAIGGLCLLALGVLCVPYVQQFQFIRHLEKKGGKAGGQWRTWVPANVVNYMEKHPSWFNHALVEVDYALVRGADSEDDLKRLAAYANTLDRLVFEDCTISHEGWMAFPHLPLVDHLDLDVASI